MEEAKNKQQIVIDPRKLKVVPISQVRPNTWNPKDKDTREYKQVYDSIKANGLMGFIVVRLNPTTIDGIEVPYEIIDGEQRYTSCKELEYEEIVIYNEGEVTDKRAQELTIWWQAQVPFNRLSLAKMVNKMIEQYGDIHSYFNEKQLEDMKKLAKFDWGQYQPASAPPPPVGQLLKNFMVQVTNDQYGTIQEALKIIKLKTNEDINDAEALVSLCQKYIAAINQVEGNSGENGDSSQPQTPPIEPAS